MKEERAQIALGTLVLSIFVFDLLIGSGLHRTLGLGGRVIFGLTFGLIHAQIASLAVWSAWGSANVFVRFTVGLFAATLLGYFAAGRTGNQPSAHGVFYAVLVQWISIHLSLALTRRLFGWRLVKRGMRVATEPTQRRMTLGELLAWIAVIGTIISLARAIREILGDEPDHQMRSVLLSPFLLLVAVRSVLFALPILGAAFVQKHLPIWMLLALFYCSATCTAEVVLGWRSYGSASWWVRGTEFVTTAICLLLVRFSGFRVNAGWSNEDVT